MAKSAARRVSVSACSIDIAAGEIRNYQMDRRKVIAVCVLLWLVAVAVRLLNWQDNRLDASRVEWAVAAEYRESATLLSHGDFSAYLYSLPFLTHPPGYPLFWR
jgi:hypothetical protein